MRIVMLLLSYYLPDPRVERESKALSSRGHEVSIIAWNRTGTLQSHETRGQYEVFRLPPSLPSFYGRVSTLGKLLTKGLATCLFYVRSVIAVVRMKPAVVHAHDLDTLVPGILLKWVTGAKLIFDSHEDYPAMIGNDLGRMGYWLALAVQTLLFKVPDIVIASNQAISRRLSRQVNSYVVENLVDLEWFDGASPLRMDWESARPVVVHAGAVQKGKGLEQLFQALPMMKAGVDVVVAGYLPEGYGHVLKDMCQERGIRVRFTGFIDKNLFPAIIRSSAIGLALLQPTPNNIGNLPNKLFEYMAGGLPVIASDFPLMHQIICKNECGLTVDPTSPQEIAEAVDYLIFHPAEARRLGSNGRKIVEEQYSWTQGEQVLLRAYAALCTQRSSLATASSSW